MVTKNDKGVTTEGAPRGYPGILRLALFGLKAHRQGDTAGAKRIQNHLMRIADGSVEVTKLTSPIDPKCRWSI